MIEWPAFTSDPSHCVLKYAGTIPTALSDISAVTANYAAATRTYTVSTGNTAAYGTHTLTVTPKTPTQETAINTAGTSLSITLVVVDPCEPPIVTGPSA